MGEHERRDAVRVAAALDAQLYISFLPASLAAFTRDVSTLGACIATASPFDCSALRRVSLALPGGPLVLRAEARWQEESPAEGTILSGIRFHPVEPHAAAQLSAFVLQRAQELALFLHQDSSLRGLTLDEAEDVALQTRLMSVPAGASIAPVTSEEPSPFPIFIVYEGRIAIVAGDAATAPRLAVVGRGGVFSVPAPSHAVAETDALLLTLTADACAYLKQAKPQVALALLETLLENARAYLESGIGGTREPL